MNRLMLMLGLMSSGAFAVSLNLTRYQQQTPEWCFAASTKMIGAYLGSTIKQCDIVNAQFGTTTCCDDPTSSACMHGGDTAAALDYWGFKSTSTGGPISFAQIRSQIDNHKPFITAYKWNTGGRHAVVVDGYMVGSSGNYVEILNPLTSEYMELYEDYLTAGDIVNDEDPHVIPNTIIDIHWDPICGYDFWGLADEHYTQCYKARTRHGQYPSALASGCVNGCDGVFAGAFHGADDRPVAWENTLSNLKTFISGHTGSRPMQITVMSGSGPLYNAILTDDNGKQWQSNYASTSSVFIDTYNSLDTNYWSLKDLFGYTDNGTIKYTGTWVKDGGSGWHFDLSMPLDQVDDVDSEQQQRGFRLIRVSTFPTSSGWRAAGLWAPSTQAYQFVLNRDSNQLQTEYDNWVGNRGYSLAYIAEYGALYSAIFTK